MRSEDVRFVWLFVFFDLPVECTLRGGQVGALRIG